MITGTLAQETTFITEEKLLRLPEMVKERCRTALKNSQPNQMPARAEMAGKMYVKAGPEPALMPDSNWACISGDQYW
jgi:hypothetical protein